MTHTTRRLAQVVGMVQVVLLLGGAALTPVTSGAQAVSGRVRVALIDDLSAPTARAEVVRYGTGQPDLVLLRTGSATEEDLLAALTTLGKSKAKRGVARDQMRHIVVEGYLFDVRPDDALRTRLATALATVRARPLVRIGNRGIGRWKEFDSL